MYISQEADACLDRRNKLPDVKSTMDIDLDGVVIYHFNELVAKKPLFDL